MQLLKEIQIKMVTRGIRPEEFEDRIIFMSMFSDIDWSKGKTNSNICFSNSLKVRDFRRDVGLFWILVMKKMVRNARLQT